MSTVPCPLGSSAEACLQGHSFLTRCDGPKLGSSSKRGVSSSAWDVSVPLRRPRDCSGSRTTSVGPDLRLTVWFSVFRPIFQIFWTMDLAAQPGVAVAVSGSTTFRNRRFAPISRVASNVFKARVFVRAVSSTAEPTSVFEFQRCVRESLPKAKIYLVVLVDLQTMHCEWCRGR